MDFSMSSRRASIGQNMGRQMTQRKIIRIQSDLPQRLLSTKADSTPSPQQVLEYILSSRGIDANFYPYKKLEAFFETKSIAKTDTEYDLEVVEAVRRGNIEKLQQFHLAGRKLNCSNSFGETLLHLACRKGLVPVVKFLVHDANVCVRVVDAMGRSPLHDAFWTSEPNMELIDLLLDNDRDLLYVKDARGHSPLSYTRHKHWGVWASYLKARGTAKLMPIVLRTVKLK